MYRTAHSLALPNAQFAINDMNRQYGPHLYAPNEASVLSGLLANVREAATDPAFFLSANFIGTEARKPCQSGLDVPGFRKMYEKAEVPVLSVADALDQTTCPQSDLWGRTQHPNARMHGLLADLFARWLESANATCSSVLHRMAALDSVEQSTPLRWGAQQEQGIQEQHGLDATRQSPPMSDTREDDANVCIV